MSVQQKKFKAIADKIREKTGETGIIKPSDFVNKIDDVFAAGVASVPPVEGDRYDEGYADGRDELIDNFWRSYQNDGARSIYSYAFNNMRPDMFYPKHNIKATGINMHQIFRGFNNTVGVNWNENFDLAQRLQDCGVKLDFSSVTSCQLPFVTCRMTHIPEVDLTNCGNADRFFYDVKGLKKIDKVIGGEKTSFYGTYGTSFYKLPDLTYIRFGGVIGAVSNIDLSGSPSLEVECFTNEDGDGLFDCLADKSTDTTKTWTCTIGATNLAKLTDAQKAVATEKGWTLT